MKLVRIIGFFLCAMNLTQLSVAKPFSVTSEQEEQEVTEKEEQEKEGESQEEREELDQN